MILAKVNTLADALGTNKGSLGSLINDPGLYKRAVGTLTEAQNLVTQINQGKGTLGKLMTDPTLYNRANETIAPAAEYCRSDRCRQRHGGQAD